MLIVKSRSGCYVPINGEEAILFPRPFRTQVPVLLHCHSLNHWHSLHESWLSATCPHPNPREEGEEPKSVSFFTEMCWKPSLLFITHWLHEGAKEPAKNVISSWDSLKKRKQHVSWVKFWHLCQGTHEVIFPFYGPHEVLHCFYCPRKDRNERSLCFLCTPQWDSHMLLEMFYLMQRDVPFNYKNIQVLFMYFINCFGPNSYAINVPFQQLNIHFSSYIWISNCSLH